MNAIDAAVDVFARLRRWSPIGERVTIAFDDCGDARLAAFTFRGIVRAYGVGDDGTPADLLVELDDGIDYNGHYVRNDIRFLVTRPCLRWRRTSRLLLSWAAFRFIDAPSFRDATYDRTIAVGRIRRT